MTERLRRPNESVRDWLLSPKQRQEESFGLEGALVDTSSDNWIDLEPIVFDGKFVHITIEYIQMFSSYRKILTFWNVISKSTETTADQNTVL